MFVVDLGKCTGCANCIDVCPLEAISIQNEQAVINVDECAECGACMNACPNEAIFERELEPGIEERIINGEVNAFAQDKSLSSEPILQARPVVKLTESNEGQSIIPAMRRNRTRSIRGDRGCGNRGSKRKGRI